MRATVSVWAVEYSRISFADARRSLFEDADQRNHSTDAANSGGSEITFATSKERVGRILRLAGKRCAMCWPFGLGKDCDDAVGY